MRTITEDQAIKLAAIVGYFHNQFHSGVTSITIGHVNIPMNELPELKYALTHIEGETIDKDKVHKEYGEIMMGAGWATDEYIINLTVGLNDHERFKLMGLLAKNSKLVNEEDLINASETLEGHPYEGSIDEIRTNYPECIIKYKDLKSLGFTNYFPSEAS